jgi:hypothetical protein
MASCRSLASLSFMLWSFAGQCGLVVFSFVLYLVSLPGRGICWSGLVCPNVGLLIWGHHPLIDTAAH